MKLLEMSGLEPGQLVEWLHVYERQTHEVSDDSEIICPTYKGCQHLFGACEAYEVYLKPIW